MDLQNLIQTLSDFVYELALWPLLIPMSLFRFAFRAAKVSEYVNLELDKPAGQRYPKYLSPMLYWLLIGIVPSFMLIRKYFSLSTNPLCQSLLAQPAPLSFTEVLIFWIWIPLAWAATTLWRERDDITRESLRRPFYVQCMVSAPYLPWLMIIILNTHVSNAQKLANPLGYSQGRMLFWGLMPFPLLILFFRDQGALLKSQKNATSRLSTVLWLGVWVIAFLLMCLFGWLAVQVSVLYR